MPVKVEVHQITISIPLRYGGEDVPYDFPLRNGDQWEAIVDIDTGQINGWPEGKSGNLYTKVCDSGVYTLFEEGNPSSFAERRDYVPNGIVPGEYGDYVDLKINDKGVITNWPTNPDISAFFPDREED